MYYEQESAIDGSDMNRLERRLCVRSTEEKAALAFVLDEFFEKEESLYFNNRCESEIKKYQDKLETAIKAGKASAEARRKKATKKQRKPIETATEDEQEGNGSATPVVSDVEQDSNDRSTTVQPTNNHEPRTKNQLNNSLSNAQGEYSVIDSIQDWQQPELSEVNEIILIGAPPVPALSSQQYKNFVREFKNYYAEKEIEGSYIKTEGRRKDMLCNWIKRDYQKNVRTNSWGNSNANNQPASNNGQQSVKQSSADAYAAKLAEQRKQRNQTANAAATGCNRANIYDMEAPV
jgi:uncharacterized protein YdaU (DUF1376 family)